MGKHLLFTYGTLKRGFSRSNALREQRYIGTARCPAHAIFGYGGYPAMVDKTLAEAAGVEFPDNNEVYGELYEVDDACMQELDKIEGVDKGVFVRKEVRLDTVVMSSLPMTDGVWAKLRVPPLAHAYLFKGKLKGAANCGQIWGQK